jgi:hypothetical protein
MTMVMTVIRVVRPKVVTYDWDVEDNTIGVTSRVVISGVTRSNSNPTEKVS